MKVQMTVELDDVLDIIRFSGSDSLVAAARDAIRKEIAIRDGKRLRLVAVPEANRIKTITSIRRHLMWGLKEANDFVKAVEAGVSLETPVMPAHVASLLLHELRQWGCVVDYAA